MTKWTTFLKKHAGKGYTKSELSKKYCRENLVKKIAINMREAKYVSKEQAIAVAYSQIRKAYPECAEFFKKK
uniref:Uncharacterized protein n=1 Tax=viral metagenome TaxID=1070528 RepID=A0A6C0KU28_9ZZZZ